MSRPELFEIPSDDAEIARLRALGVVAEPDPQVLVAALLRLEHLIAAEPVAPVQSSRPWRALLPVGGRPTGNALPRPGPRRPRLVLAAAAVVLAASAVTAPAWLPLGRGDRPAASADAATFLRSVAAVSAAQPGDWKDAAFWYSRSRTDDGSTLADREIWIAHHGAGRLSAGSHPEVLDGPMIFSLGGAASTDWDGLWSLPTDPVALERVLREGRQGAGPDADSELFTSVGDLLRESPVPPAVRSALYRVAANVPGVRLVGAVTDSVGRRGVAVERGEGQLLMRYVVDPADGRLLEEQSGATRGPAVCTTSNPFDPTPDQTSYPSAPAAGATAAGAPAAGATAAGAPAATATAGSAGAGVKPLPVGATAGPGVLTPGDTGSATACFGVYFRATYLDQGPVADDHSVPATP